MNRLALILLTALAPISWGTTYIVTTEMLPAGHPLLAGLLRALPAGLIALALGRTLPRGVWWVKASVLGTLNVGGFFALLFVAAERLPGGVAAAVAGVQPLIIVTLGALVLQERVRLTTTLAAAVGTAGVALVVLGPAAALDPVGVLAAVGGVACTASGIVLTKLWGRPPGVGAIGYAGWQLTAGGLFLLPLALTIEGLPAQLDGTAVLGYLWLGTVGGLVAYTLWFHGIQRLPVAVPGLLVLLSPVVAALLGVLLAGESFSAPQSLGLLLALASLVVGPLGAVRTREAIATPSADVLAGRG
ncbi:MAG: EamA family transporter [Actinomycetota bacterium]